MEYVPAQSLPTVLATRGSLFPEEVAEIGSQIATQRPLPLSPSSSPSPPGVAIPLPPVPQPLSAAVSPQDTGAQLGAAVTDYYALMPAELDVAWSRLTSDYQRDHAGGSSGYQAFWRSVQRVAISQVSATPPDSVTATLTYLYRDGRIVEEQTGFGLVADRTFENTVSAKASPGTWPVRSGRSTFCTGPSAPSLPAGSRIAPAPPHRFLKGVQSVIDLTGPCDCV